MLEFAFSRTICDSDDSLAPYERGTNLSQDPWTTKRRLRKQDKQFLALRELGEDHLTEVISVQNLTGVKKHARARALNFGLEELLDDIRIVPTVREEKTVWFHTLKGSGRGVTDIALFRNGL